MPPALFRRPHSFIPRPYEQQTRQIQKSAQNHRHAAPFRSQEGRRQSRRQSRHGVQPKHPPPRRASGQSDSRHAVARRPDGHGVCRRGTGQLCHERSRVVAQRGFRRRAQSGRPVRRVFRRRVLLPVRPVGLVADCGRFGGAVEKLPPDASARRQTVQREASWAAAAVSC